MSYRNYFPTRRLAGEKIGRISKRIFTNVGEHFAEVYKPLIPSLR